ncbi:MAG: PilZ domain-containing protein [Candidatus Rokuibacteriota bacterium]
MVSLDAARNRRQHPRTRVSWPVVVETASHRFPCQVMDISPHGAKVMTRARLRTGTVVRLQIIPPDGSPLRVGALVWRVDSDGVAFFFARGVHHRFIRVA